MIDSNRVPSFGDNSIIILKIFTNTKGKSEENNNVP